MTGSFVLTSKIVQTVKVIDILYKIMEINTSMEKGYAQSKTTMILELTEFFFCI